MNKQNRVECPNCHYLTWKFCDLCDGRGFIEIHVGVDKASGVPYFGQSVVDMLNSQTYANRPSKDADVTINSIHAARKALESQLDPRKLAYSSPDPEGEKRRLAALNLAMNAYQIANCPGMFGSPANNAMSWEDIVPLANRMTKFIAGEGFSPHEE